jgi:hypothetical protein
MIVHIESFLSLVVYGWLFMIGIGLIVLMVHFLVMWFIDKFLG